jgi:hypothetical protein
MPAVTMHTCGKGVAQTEESLCLLPQVAVKVALVDTPPASSNAPCSSQLAREAQLLQQLKQKAGIPTLRKFGERAAMLQRR